MQSIKQYITGALVSTAHFALPRAYARAQEQAPTTTPAPDVVVIPAEGLDALLQQLYQLEADLAGVKADLYNPPAAEPEPETADQAPEPEPPPQLNVWEDGTCWTPPDAQALHLCGADASDGYVVRWIGAAGDSAGPRIPDANRLATDRAGPGPVWTGTHPATGESIAITWQPAGHQLAVYAAGSLLYRIDRQHQVTK